MTPGGAGGPAAPAPRRDPERSGPASGRSIAAAVRIERQAASHAAGLFEALADPAAHEFLDGRPLASPEAWRERIARLRRGSGDPDEIWLNWTVFLDGRIVGYTQATLRPDPKALPGGAPRADLAFVLAPSVWGRGVTFEACRQTIARLAEDHGVRELVADTHVANARSARLLARLGLDEVGVVGEDRHFHRFTPRE